MASNSLAQALLFFLCWVLAWMPFCLFLSYKLRWRPFTPVSPAQKLPLVLSLYAIAPFVLAGLLSVVHLSWGTVGVSVDNLASGSFFAGLVISVLGIAGLFSIFFGLGWMSWSFPSRLFDREADRGPQGWQTSVSQDLADADATRSPLNPPAVSPPAVNPPEGWVAEDPSAQNFMAGSQDASWMLVFLLLVLGIVVGGIEELVFRGFLTSRLAHDGSIWTAGAIASLIFALMHLIWEGTENIPQLPGLWVMGVVLTVAWWLDQQHIALAWGLHAGWVWSIATVDTLGLVKYSKAAPVWVTGVGQKPLAGVGGILALMVTGVALFLLFS